MTDFSGFMNSGRIQGAYANNIDAVDLWVGIISERRRNGGELG